MAEIELKKLRIKKRDNYKETLLAMEIGKKESGSGLKLLNNLKTAASRLKAEKRGEWETEVIEDKKATFKITRIS